MEAMKKQTRPTFSSCAGDDIVYAADAMEEADAPPEGSPEPQGQLIFREGGNPVTYRFSENDLNVLFTVRRITKSGKNAEVWMDSRGDLQVYKTFREAVRLKQKRV